MIGALVVLILSAGSAAIASSAVAAEVVVAQAANFLAPMREIAAAFEKSTGHRVLISAGSTGKLYAQITQGAPFDVYLAADQAHPRLLEDEGLAMPETHFTYAVGRLTLWSPDADRITADGAAVLRQGNFRHLAIANPKTAPFGTAAVQVMRKLGVYDRVREKLVQGENVGQAFQFVVSGNAELGFVSLSQVVDPRNEEAGSRWDVPQDLYDPLRMDAVLLKRARGNVAARALLDYVKGPEARGILTRYGYAVVP